MPSPIINKAVKAAIADDFPALVPAGVPAGWTVAKATYSPQARRLVAHRAHRPERRERHRSSSRRARSASIVEQNLPDAQPAGTVDLSDFGTGKWDAYSGT